MISRLQSQKRLNTSKSSVEIITGLGRWHWNTLFLLKMKTALLLASLLSLSLVAPRPSEAHKNNHHRNHHHHAQRRHNHCHNHPRKGFSHCHPHRRGGHHPRRSRAGVWIYPGAPLYPVTPQVIFQFWWEHQIIMTTKSNLLSSSWRTGWVFVKAT